MKKSYEERAKIFIRRICKMASENHIQLATRGSLRVLTNFFNNSGRQKIHLMSGCARTALITSDYVVKIDTGIEDYGTCIDEVEAYDYAVQCGVERILAKPTPYTYNDIDFYIYPRVDHVGRYYKGKDFWDCISFAEDDFLTRHIDDLHNANIGFYKNGEPVVLDYASTFDLS